MAVLVILVILYAAMVPQIAHLLKLIEGLTLVLATSVEEQLITLFEDTVVQAFVSDVLVAIVDEVRVPSEGSLYTHTMHSRHLARAYMLTPLCFAHARA